MNGPSSSSNNNSTRVDSLLRKIRALRAKAEDPSVTEAEANLYAAKVAEMLQQNNLSESVLEVDDESSEIVEERWEGDYLTDEWRRHICNRAAELYFCKGYSMDSGRSGKSARVHMFVGKAHNIVVAKEMSEYLINTTLRLGKAWRTTHSASHSEFVNFLRGCGIRIAERLTALRREQTKSAPQRAANGNPANLPALYADEDSLIAEFTKKLGLRNMTSRQTAGGHGGQAGYAAGNTVSLNTQVGGRSSARLLA